MKYLAITLFLIFGFQKADSQKANYNSNINSATNLFRLKLKIEDNILLGLIPRNAKEFALLYRTSELNNGEKTANFFDTITQAIFNKVIIDKNEKFYLPSLQLASFADGEFGETFTDNLEAIIALDKEKFCKSIIGKSYLLYNPIKYYSDQNKCY